MKEVFRLKLNSIRCIRKTGEGLTDLNDDEVIFGTVCGVPELGRDSMQKWRTSQEDVDDGDFLTGANSQTLYLAEPGQRVAIGILGLEWDKKSRAEDLLGNYQDAFTGAYVASGLYESDDGLLTPLEKSYFGTLSFLGFGAGLFAALISNRNAPEIVFIAHVVIDTGKFFELYRKLDFDNVKQDDYQQFAEVRTMRGFRLNRSLDPIGEAGVRLDLSCSPDRVGSISAYEVMLDFYPELN